MNLPEGWTGARSAPACPEGWTTGPPDFVGVGVQRCGTSWWHRSLRLHPRVAQADHARKEWHYFDRFWQGAVPDDLVEAYHRLFPRPPGSIVGEWTPRYMLDFWSIQLLARAAPEARILILLRDPIERFLSAVARLLKMEVDGDVRMSSAMMADCVHRGMYFDQVRQVFEVFPREQVLVLQYERCTRDPVEQMAATLSFLGLDPLKPERTKRLTRPSSGTGNRPHLTPEMRSGLVTRFADDVRRLEELCPEIDVSLWPNFADLAGSGRGLGVRRLVRRAARGAR
jgi:hypothetical protein